MTTKKSRRQRLFADRKLQGELLVHTAIYWFYCLFSVTLIAVCWILFMQQPDTSSELFRQLWLSCGPALLGSVLLLPLVLLDCLRLSNRFAGPMFRFQRAMRELAEDGTTNEVQLRQGDYWVSFADDLNVVIKRLRGESPAVAVETDNSAGTNSADTVTPPATAVAERPASEALQATESAPLPDVTPADGQASVHSIYSDLSV